MRILLDAYFDNNFGDDLFVSTVLKRWPQDLFYTFCNSTHAGVLKRALAHPNLVVLPGGCSMHTALPLDGYIMVGGDVLPDGVDYTRRIEGMRHVKNSGGFVAMLGFSLYEDYSEKTRQNLAVMASLADSIVPRDSISAARFRELVPDARITPSTDMAFTASYGSAAPDRDLLGIAPRRKLYSTDEAHRDFCKTMAALADGWLAAHPNGRIRFLALSTGEYDDRAVARDIICLMSNPGPTEIFSQGEEDLIRGIKECGALIPTRFHALVFALIFGIPFVPVPYEVKLTQLLDELGYAGIRIPYGRAADDHVISQALASLSRFPVTAEALENYQRKADAFFLETDRLMESRRQAALPEAFFQPPVCHAYEALEAARNENGQLSRDNAYLTRQVEALNEWVRQLQQQRQAFEQEYLTANALREAQAVQLANTVADYAALEARIRELSPLAEKYRRLCEKVPFVDKLLK